MVHKARCACPTRCPPKPRVSSNVVVHGHEGARRVGICSLRFVFWPICPENHMGRHGEASANAVPLSWTSLFLRYWCGAMAGVVPGLCVERLLRILRPDRASDVFCFHFLLRFA